MTSKNKLSSRLQLLAAIAALISITIIVIFALRTNNKNNEQPIIEPAVNQEAITKKPVENTEVKKEAAAPGTTITSSTSNFGPMLFDGKGQAIYIWELEQSSTAECYGDCAVAWPPVLTVGTPVASGGVESKLLGTTTRTDGTIQVTYNNHPLYYYAHEKVGEVKCHNIKTHGGLWWVIQPNGNRAT